LLGSVENKLVIDVDSPKPSREDRKKQQSVPLKTSGCAMDWIPFKPVDVYTK